MTVPGPFKRIRDAASSPPGAPHDPLSGIDSATDTTADRYRMVSDEPRSSDAKARIMSVLAEYGLESLADWVWQQLLEGRSDAEIMQDVRLTPEFKTRFPAIESRTKAGLPPLSPGEYVAYERQARQIMRAAGLPEQFYDTADDFTTFLTNDMSISELNDRVQLARQAVYDVSPEVRDALMRDYGMTEGFMAAAFLDEQRAVPLLEKQYRAAQISGAGTRTGFGTTLEQRERLADLGITAEQAQQGFGILGDSRELFASLDRTEDVIDSDTQLGAVFEGSSAAQRRIEQRRAKRKAMFEGGGSYASSQSGVVGLGDTS